MTREMTKSLPVSKWMVYNSYLKVIAKDGSAGLDNQSIEQFHENLPGNLNNIWNNMTSGSYFQSPLQTIFVSRKQGGKRSFDIPSISDRIAQGVVRDYLEPTLENIFHPGSFGYQPGRSVYNAIKQYQDNSIKYGWVLHVNITGFFNRACHKTLLQLLQRHVQEKWILLYAEGWLKARMKQENVPEIKVGSKNDTIAPLFANIYLHHSFDKWMDEVHPQNPFERYVDDVAIHCNSGDEARQLLEKLKARMEQYKLELHSERTNIIYCKSYLHSERHHNNSFGVLGHSFLAGTAKNKSGRRNSLVVFCAAVSRRVKIRIRANVRAALRMRWSSKKHLPV